MGRNELSSSLAFGLRGGLAGKGGKTVRKIGHGERRGEKQVWKSTTVRHGRGKRTVCVWWCRRGDRWLRRIGWMNEGIDCEKGASDIRYGLHKREDRKEEEID